MSLHRLKVATFKLIVPILCSYLFFQPCTCSQQSETLQQGQSETSVGRTSKNLFPFVWVTFQPSPCGTNNEGVCVQRGKCTKRGGTTTGTCQEGFGECCMFTEKCNVNRTRIDVDQLVTVLESPMTANTECVFRFRKVSREKKTMNTEPNICQIRLEFETFESARADPEGNCVTDRLRITNSITVDRDFTTCGNLKDQHMYLTFGSQDSIEVAPILKLATSRYKIIATRIPCNSVNRAPDYCLQYFTKTTDMVRSFDFGGQQQNNQRYTVCVKPMGASSEVIWRTCSTGAGSRFDITSNNQLTPLVCSTTDWVQVKGGDKLCEGFNEQRSTWKPYELLVNFDEKEFPPPPVFFTMPVDPANCAAVCLANPSPALTCFCLDNPTPTNQTCQCTVNTPGVVVDPDVDNTGFCLEYSQ